MRWLLRHERRSRGRRCWQRCRKRSGRSGSEPDPRSLSLGTVSGTVGGRRRPSGRDARSSSAGVSAAAVVRSAAVRRAGVVLPGAGEPTRWLRSGEGSAGGRLRIGRARYGRRAIGGSRSSMFRSCRLGTTGRYVLDGPGRRAGGTWRRYSQTRCSGGPLVASDALTADQAPGPVLRGALF